MACARAGRSRGAVTSDVRRLGSDFADHLRLCSLLVFSSILFGDWTPVFGHGRGARKHQLSTLR
jgi:hypothetical protein